MPAKEPWFYQFNGPKTITINESAGLEAISVVSTTTTNGTISSSRKIPLAGVPTATSVTLSQNVPQTIGVLNPGFDNLDGVVITAPTGCTIKIQGI